MGARNRQQKAETLFVTVLFPGSDVNLTSASLIGFVFFCSGGFMGVVWRDEHNRIPGRM